MTQPHVLDTSALMAHFLNESGWKIVEQLLETETGHIFINAVAWLEFQACLKEVAPSPAQRERVLQIYAELLDEALPVTRDTAATAWAFREAATRRLPNSDALIAATAKLRGAILVHRDPHFAAIPAKLLKQIALPPKTSTPQSQKP
jgi:predicted nucleic acid-binding protein